MFMNKKSLKLTFTSIIISLTLGLASCGGDAPAPHVHTFSSEWSYDSTFHWHAATCGHDVTSDKGEHEFTDWHNASETEKLVRECIVCDYEEYKDYLPADRVYVADVDIDLFKDYSYTVKPVVIPNNAYSNIQYEVEDPSIIEFIDNTAYAKGVGSTYVYVYNDEDNDSKFDEDEKYTVMAFSVSEPEEGKSVFFTESAPVTIKVDQTYKLSYSQEGISTSGLDYGFYSDDESICTISAGTVKGHKPGTTRMSVTLKGYRGYLDITVIDNVDDKGTRAYEIRSQDNLVLNVGDTKSISYEILPENCVDRLATATSSNSRVVRVNSDNSITALSGGTAVIELATSNGKTSRTLVTVKDTANNGFSYYDNYYGNLTWENGADLKAKLHDIISNNVTPLSYNSPNWETNQYADQDLYDHSYVYTVYSDTNNLKTDTNTGWQREHAFAASLMTGASTGVAVTDLGRSTDFHNLFASNAGANGSRGNKNLGYANKESAKVATKENCIYAGNVFEPNDVDKGRLARAIFYMGVMYNENEAVTVDEKWTFKGPDTSSHSGASKTLKISFGEDPIEIVESNIDYEHISLDKFMYSEDLSTQALVEYYRDIIRDEFPSLEEQNYDLFRQKAYEKYMDNSNAHAIGYLSDLIKWNSYEVDLVEMQHNESVYTHNSVQGKGKQGNRNPFVDYPQLVDYIYGDLKDQAGSISELTPSYLTLNMGEDEIHHYSVESETIPAFKSGTKPSVDDFDIKAIKNNLSQGILDKSKINVEDYTFTDDDVLTGKVIEIYTDKNTLRVPCKVTSDSVITFDTCTWNHIDDNTSGHNKDCYGSWDSNGEANNASFSGLGFVVTLGNAKIAADNKISNSKTQGTKFGTGSDPYIPESLTLETKEAVNFNGKNKVNAVFVIASTASGKNYNYEIFIGGTSVKSASFTGTNQELSVILPAGQELTGKVKIVFSNVKAAINIRGLAINVIA